MTGMTSLDEKGRSGECVNKCLVIVWPASKQMRDYWAQLVLPPPAASHPRPHWPAKTMGDYIAVGEAAAARAECRGRLQPV